MLPLKNVRTARIINLPSLTLGIKAGMDIIGETSSPGAMMTLARGWEGTLVWHVTGMTGANLT